ncbi:hypothetical protein PGUG_02776 [Meyerozyma guilliermondii ATCC 6260]|uniref:Uncharacterized protein n=1 Tax=Meyerozyma guilliermondii (strain ATCC 6260 / CBS 566 / DSM 6381 / JCM 1539 / NBRC 10279 / NRRL Y-324) TaxID=294746 RepID=A5DHM5_PICGU|nr:uncharacterized protein PGUG_02776 [Meyerozyma guilliermondii ATCC 6260]EDK38678.2 hypothetical protein PGUG_02776 [Meyerozyma guilliermondii ATCC 6260]
MIDLFFGDSNSANSSDYEHSEDHTPVSPITPNEEFFVSAALKPSDILNVDADSRAFHPYKIDEDLFRQGMLPLGSQWVVCARQTFINEPFEIEDPESQFVSISTDVDAKYCKFTFCVNLLAYRMIVTQGACPRKLIALKTMKGMPQYKNQDSGSKPMVRKPKVLSSATKYPCRLNIAELSCHLNLENYHIRLTMELEENILHIFEKLCNVSLDHSSWVRTFSTADKEAKIATLMRALQPWYPEFSKKQLEIIIKRGMYRATQGRLRRERRHRSRRKYYTSCTPDPGVNTEVGPEEMIRLLSVSRCEPTTH